MAAQPARPRAALEVLAAAPHLAPAERLLLDGWARGNARAGRELAAAALRRPLVDVAAALALFSLNRHGVPGARSGPMAAAASAAWDDPG